MNKKEQLLFTHRCSVLLESGISLGETLTIISRMQKSKKLNIIVNFIKGEVEKGVSLHKSMRSSKVQFDSTLMSMIENGENSGTLAISLKEAYKTLEKAREIKKKIIGALLYPSFIACATIGMTLFLLMYIFPKIIPLLSSMNITLPLLTRAVRAFYYFSIDYGLWVATIIFLIFFLSQILYKKNNATRTFLQNTFLSIPIIGLGIKKYFISTHCRSIGVLLSNGQSLSNILKQNSTSIAFEPYRKSWEICYLDVTKGVALSVSMKKSPKLFEPLLHDMLYIGERTGSLSTMLEHVSNIYEQEIDTFVKQFGLILEPALMVGMGLIVGSVALSIILPIYEITNHLSN